MHIETLRECCVLSMSHVDLQREPMMNERRQCAKLLSQGKNWSHKASATEIARNASHYIRRFTSLARVGRDDPSCGLRGLGLFFFTATTSSRPAGHPVAGTVRTQLDPKLFHKITIGRLHTRFISLQDVQRHPLISVQALTNVPIGRYVKYLLKCG